MNLQVKDFDPDSFIDYHAKYYPELWEPHTDVELREQQVIFFNNVVNDLVAGFIKPECCNRRMAQAPTGFGKTILFCHVIMMWRRLFPGSNILLVVDQQELVQQTIEKLVMCSGTYDYGFKIGEIKQSEVQSMTNLDIAMIQTIRASRGRRMKKLREKRYDLVIVDECHATTNNSYANLIKALTHDPNPEYIKYMEEKAGDTLFDEVDDGTAPPEFLENSCQIFGVTATPWHSSKKKQKIFQDLYRRCVYRRTTLASITDGELANVIYYRGMTDVYVGDVKVKANGEFDSREMTDRINIVARHELILDHCLKIYEERGFGKIKVFCESVAHTEDLTQFFRDRGYPAEYITGDTPTGGRQGDQRGARIREFDEAPMGEIRFLCSCGCLTKGFDCKTIETVVIARPVLEESLYIQMAGRGLRLDPVLGKDTVAILDIVDCIGQNKKIQSCFTTLFDLPEDLEGDVKKIYGIKEEPREPREVDETVPVVDDQGRRQRNNSREALNAQYAFTLMAVPGRIRESGLNFIGVGTTKEGHPKYTLSVGDGDDRIELVENMTESYFDSIISKYRHKRYYGTTTELLSKIKKGLKAKFKDTKYMWCRSTREKKMSGGATGPQISLLIKPRYVKILTEMGEIKSEDDIYNMSKGQASDAIEKVTTYYKLPGSISNKQKGFLNWKRRESKIRCDESYIDGLSFREASSLIDALNKGVIIDNPNKHKKG